MSACATSTTAETARQLSKSETVLAGSIELPGATAIPKVGAQLTYGLGRGDISARLGTALFLYTAGVGARFYPTPAMTLSLQANASALYEIGVLGVAEGWVHLYSLTPRISSAVKGERVFYGGFQTNLHHRIHKSYDPSSPQGKQSAIAPGTFIGWDFYLPRLPIGGQIELLFSPLIYRVGEDTLRLISVDHDSISGLELSVALYWRPGSSAQSDLEPTAPLLEPDHLDSNTLPTTPGGIPLY